MSKIVQVDMIVQQIMNLFPDNKQNNKNKEKQKETDVSPHKKLSINGFLSETKGEAKPLNTLNTFSIDQETAPITSEPIREEKINELKKKEDGKNTLEHISILEDIEEEIKSRPHTTAKGEYIKKEKKREKFCGKKRKAQYKIKNNSGESKNLTSSQSIVFHRDIPQLSSITEPPLDEEKENKILIEKELLTDLVKKEGFMKVFNCLTITPLNRKDPLEKQIDDIINTIGLLRTSLILSQIKFETIDNIQNNNNKSKEKENDKIPEHENDIKNNNISNINFISSRTRSSKSHDSINIIPEPLGKKRKHSKRKKLKAVSMHRIYTREKDKEKTGSKAGVEQACSVKNVTINELINERLELGAHFQKDKEGKIYKYLKHHIRENKGDKMYIYYCADTRCKSKACYYLTGMKFQVLNEHGLKHEDHCYMQKKDRTDKYRFIIEEFKARNCNDAQVFKKSDGTALVKWYDSV